MRVAVVGAFPFPYPQGSQVYVAEQIRALREAGAEPVQVTYRPGALQPSGASGPSFSKVFADAALLMRYVREHRRRPFDVALAHNTEAALVAISARPLTGVRVVYVAHTILRYELSAYAPDSFGRAVDAIGRGVDRFVARRADGIVALSEDARAILAGDARCDIEVIPPGAFPLPPPQEEEIAAACRRAGVERNGFVLYAGNLDGYQDLELVDRAAARLRDDPQVLVATHDARDGATRLRSLRIFESSDWWEVRSLAFGAAALVLPRRRPGGFPIKLLNYMETGRPIVAFRRIAPGLEDGRSACLLPEDAGSGEIADALRDLLADPGRAAAIGAAARAHLAESHAWPDLAERTLAFVKRVAA